MPRPKHTAAVRTALRAFHALGANEEAIVLAELRLEKKPPINLPHAEASVRGAPDLTLEEALVLFGHEDIVSFGPPVDKPGQFVDFHNSSGTGPLALPSSASPVTLPRPVSGEEAAVGRARLGGGHGNPVEHPRLALVSDEQTVDDV